MRQATPSDLHDLIEKRPRSWQLRPSPKYAPYGTVRVISPTDTIRRVTPLMETVGVTRVAEVTGLDRPGLLYELTTTLSKLNLNIASAHVATFGERVVEIPQTAFKIRDGSVVLFDLTSDSVAQLPSAASENNGLASQER